MRPPSLALALALTLGACSPSSSSAYGTPPLADLKVPSAAPATWELSAAGARIVPLGLEHALFLPRGTEPQTVKLPFGAGLTGARSVRVMCMADGPFQLTGALAGQALSQRAGSDTKRQVHTLELQLAAPLGADSGSLELRCHAAQVPVLILRVQVMG